MKGVKHYKRDGTLHKLFHFKDLSKKAKVKAKKK